MATDENKNQALATNERQMRGLEELAAKAAGAAAGVKLIEKIVDAAEKNLQQGSEEAQFQADQSNLQQTGEQIIGTQALAKAQEKTEEIQKQTEATAKATYDNMVSQRKEAEEKKKKSQKTSILTSKSPAQTSVVKEAAKSVLDPSGMYQFFIPGSGFLTDAFKKIL